MNVSLRHIAQALGGELTGGQVLAPGPNHSASDRSLSVKLTETGNLLVHSFAGDDPIACKDYIRARCGMPKWEPQESRSDSERAGPSSGKGHAKPRGQVATRPQVTGEYIYQLADGAPYLRVQRTTDKQFWQSHWTGSGWTKGKPPGPKIP